MPSVGHRTAAKRSEIAAHYGRPGLATAFREALRSAGRPADRVALDHLAQLDHFHTRGVAATAELAQLAGIASGMAVLDLGGGLGGPARTLAAFHGAAVTVLDLTPEYCEAGAELTRSVGLADGVRFREGGALEPPFADGTFDVAWTQHSTMNIADKARLYREAHRVLRPGGRLAMHEIIAGGTAGGLHFPVPWASEARHSSLVPAAELRETIARAGFAEPVWRDVTATTADWMRERLAAPVTEMSGIRILLGDGARTALENLGRNLDEGRVAVVMAVFDRLAPGAGT